MKHAPFGSLSADRFLRTHWQKKPLFVRSALAGIERDFTPADIVALACRDDVESRLVTRQRGRWSVLHGPFARRKLNALPARGWSLLVQGADMHLAKAHDLLQRFACIPHARHDDIMLSLSPRGGGVGAHFDSYDVILLQAAGRRRWRIGAQPDLDLVAGAPLRILRTFRPERELIVEPGDLLYLPPSYAHEGVALSENCITVSVGFRAPSKQEMVSGFLQWLQEAIEVEGRYRDPALARQHHPAELGDAMVKQVAAMLRSIRWPRRAVERFLGEHLTEPKAHVWFDPPEQPLAFAPFREHARTRGIRLGMKSRMLFRGEHVFINGESIVVPPSERKALRTLADRREAAPFASASQWAAHTIYTWYRNGYVELA